MDHCESPSRGHCHKCFIKQPCIIQLSLTWIQPPGCLPWSFVQNGPPVVSRIRLVGFLVLYKIPWPDSNSIIHAFIYHIRSFHISASAVTMMDHQHSLMAGILSPQAGHVRILGDAPTSTMLQSSPLSIQIYIYMHTYVIKAQALYTRPGPNKILPALPSSGAAEAVFHA